MAKIIRNLSIPQFGDLLREEWEKGNLSQEVADSIQAGRVPRQLISNEHYWTIERIREGIRVTIDDEGLDDQLNLRKAA